MLSDVDIRDMIRGGQITLVDPDGANVISRDTGREIEGGQLQAHGYDLRVDAIQSWYEPDWRKLKEGEPFKLHPGEFVAIRTYERIRLANSVAGTVHAMARRTLTGLTHISTTIHPGWAEGESEPKPIVVAVFNLSRSSIILKWRQPFCRLIFHEVRTPAELSPPTLAQVREDFEAIRYQNEKRYGRRAQVKGWGLLLLATVVAALILWSVQTWLPDYGPIAIAVVTTLLTIVLAAVRRRYNVLPGL